jgi:hypothetical protein
VNSDVNASVTQHLITIESFLITLGKYFGAKQAPLVIFFATFPVPGTTRAGFPGPRHRRGLFLPAIRLCRWSSTGFYRGVNQVQPVLRLGNGNDATASRESMGTMWKDVWSTPKLTQQMLMHEYTVARNYEIIGAHYDVPVVSLQVRQTRLTD